MPSAGNADVNLVSITSTYRPGDLVVTNLADGDQIYADIVESSDDPAYVTFRTTIDERTVQATVRGADIRTLIPLRLGKPAADARAI
jgi:hypothetical protein